MPDVWTEDDDKYEYEYVVKSGRGVLCWTKPIDGGEGK